MLYRRWLETVAKFAGETAVIECGGCARRWTFEELNREVESRPESSGEAVAFALWEAGNDVEFLLDTLAAWRDGKILCPIETRQRLIADPPREMLEAAGIAHIKLTSGSTGDPRSVLFTAEQLMADAENIVSTMGLSRESPNVSAISLAHSYGFSNLLMPLFFHGIPVVLAGSPLPGAVRSALEISRGEVTLPAVPAMWKAWSTTGILEQSSIRLAVTAGAPMPLNLEEEIHRNNGLKVHNFYGSSECGGIAFDRNDSPRSDGAEVGSAMDHVEVGVDSDGRIQVSGAAVGTCYWPPEPNGEGGVCSLGNGRFLSGDFGEVEDGRVRLTGRIGDLINVAGRKLAPEMVESVLEKDKTVAACVVFGVPSADPGRADEIVACLSPGEGFELDTTRRGVASALPSWQVPRRWWVESGLAPDARGKISRSAWRKRYLDSNS